MYKDPQSAFAGLSLDHKHLRIQDLLQHQLLIRAKLASEDVKNYLLLEIFENEGS